MSECELNVAPQLLSTIKKRILSIIFLFHYYLIAISETDVGGKKERKRGIVSI